MFNYFNVDVIVKNLFINFITIIVFTKLVGLNKVNIVKRIGLSLVAIILTVVNIIVRDRLGLFFMIYLNSIIQCLLISSILKLKISKVYTATIVSVAISYSVYTLSVLLEYIFQYLFGICDNVINMSIVCIIDFILTHLIFKIRRIKNGLNFLKEDNEVTQITVISLSSFVIILYYIAGRSNKDNVGLVICNFFILVFLLETIVKKEIELQYKRKLKDRALEEYKEKIDEQNLEINALKEESFRASKINHEFRDKLKALELEVFNFNNEFGSDLDLKKRLEELGSMHSEAMNKLKSNNYTNIAEIDSLLNLFKRNCTEYGIDFIVKVNTDVQEICKKFIDKNRFATITADHIKDAINAVKGISDNSSSRKILVEFNMKNELYEFCVYDSGIEFDSSIFPKLGKVPVTTNKEKGGSGIGFISTFETLKICRASFIIEEYCKLGEGDYTKAVKVRFDNKQEFIIKSYRGEELKKKLRDCNIKVLPLESK